MEDHDAVVLLIHHELEFLFPPLRLELRDEKLDEVLVHAVVANQEKSEDFREECHEDHGRFTGKRVELLGDHEPGGEEEDEGHDVAGDDEVGVYQEHGHDVVEEGV